LRKGRSSIGVAGQEWRRSLWWAARRQDDVIPRDLRIEHTRLRDAASSPLTIATPVHIQVDAFHIILLHTGPEFVKHRGPSHHCRHLSSSISSLSNITDPALQCTADMTDTMSTGQHLLTLPPEIREDIYRIILDPDANRLHNRDKYTDYNFHDALVLFKINKQIYIEARKVWRDLNVFVRIETPWPEAQDHVSIQGTQRQCSVLIWVCIDI